MADIRATVLLQNINRLNSRQKSPVTKTADLEKWTEPEIFRLIAFIQEHPALYNQDLREHYKRRTLLENLWTDIDIELSKPPGVSKEKYRLLREKFRRYHKEVLETHMPSDWPHYEPLKFLIPFLGRRKSKRPKFNELQHDLTVDLPRNDDDRSNSAELNCPDSPITPDQITILSVVDMDKTSTVPPEESLPANFTFTIDEELDMPPPIACSSVAATPVRPTQTYSKLEVTVLTPGAVNFQNGINDVSSQFSFAPTENRMLDFADMEEQPQSSRIERRPKSEQFKVPTVKTEPLSFGNRPSNKFRPSSRLVKPLQLPCMAQGEQHQQTVVRSYCENMAQHEGGSNNVSYSVCESITVNGVQKRKHNCICNMDSDAMFLQSMLPEMKHLSQKAKGEFKMKMARILFELSWPEGHEEPE